MPRSFSLQGSSGDSAKLDSVVKSGKLGKTPNGKTPKPDIESGNIPPQNVATSAKASETLVDSQKAIPKPQYEPSDRGEQTKFEDHRPSFGSQVSQVELHDEPNELRERITGQPRVQSQLTESPGRTRESGEPETAGVVEMDDQQDSITDSSVDSQDRDPEKVDIPSVNSEEELPKGHSADTGKADTGDTGIHPLYGVEENPPLYLALMLAFQHFLTMLGACLTTPLVLAPALCIGDNPFASAKILSALFIGCGISTFVQATIGVRLPVVEGGSLAHLVPALAILTLDEWKCHPEGGSGFNQTSFTTTSVPCNTTLGNCAMDDVTGAAGEAGWNSNEQGGGGITWEDRMRELQGALILSTMLEIFIGAFGLVGVLLRFIGPLSIAPTVALLGISLFKTAADYCSANWWIAFFTMALVALFSQYLRDVNVPFIGYKDRKIYRVDFKLFSLFPVVLAITIAWILCLILTATNAIPHDETHWAYRTRTDVQSRVLLESKWFDVPYPLHLGMPTFSAGSVLGMFSGILGAIMEAIGAFYTCARLSGAPPPPIHAINRGILIEGIGNIVNGMLGSGVGLTIFSENVASVGITRVASRRVIQLTALLLVVFGVLSKITALFVAIPHPVIGGVFMVMFGVITAVGVSNLQFVDLNSTRNLFVFGVPFLLGLALPEWLNEHPGAINTGVSFLDQMFTVLAKTPMFVGGAIAIFLDNTVPGTDEERGLAKWNASHGPGNESESPTSDTPEHSIYDFPLISGWLKNHLKWFRYLPFCPSFEGYSFLRKHTKCCCSKDKSNSLKKSGLDCDDSVKDEAANGGFIYPADNSNVTVIDPRFTNGDPRITEQLETDESGEDVISIRVVGGDRMRPNRRSDDSVTHM